MDNLTIEFNTYTSVDDLTDHGCQLHASERSTEAEVHSPATEPDFGPRVRPTDVEAKRIVEDLFIEVR